MPFVQSQHSEGRRVQCALDACARAAAALAQQNQRRGGPERADCCGPQLACAVQCFESGGQKIKFSHSLHKPAGGHLDRNGSII